ncbi:MAG: uroporphyrinogen decarboxylase family protein, partial [Eubacteriales bacterium]|nr:uroporphyrinogen decarboxylase family protein [Eubacteriales bacterium]
MNSRERFLAVLNNQKPDRIPVVATFTPQVADIFAEKFGLSNKAEDSFMADRISYTDILLKLGNDAVLVGAGRAKNCSTKKIEGNRKIDEWGFIIETHGYYGEIISRPLSKVMNIDDLNKYNIPDPLADGRYDSALMNIDKHKNDYGIIGELEACLFELSWCLVGLEKFIIDMAIGEEYIQVLLDRVLEFSTTCGKELIKLGCDMIWTGDDFGTQQGLLISPELWRENFKPRMKKMYDEFKILNPNIKIAYHSCGSIQPIIGDLIEIGLDVLNPLQPLAKDMGLKQIKEKFGDKLVLFGGVDVQEIL